MGMISYSLICFWLLMEAYSWDFKIYWQILIYIGCLFGTILIAGFILGGIQNLGSKFGGLHERLAQIVLFVLTVPTPIGLLIWKLKGAIQNHSNYQQYLWWMIPFVLAIPLPIFMICEIYKGLKQEREVSAQNRSHHFKEFRLKK
ncbi:hypothetical protein FGO68_gene3207 [Halteria grandinella]|uniref:Uncharacterized protein n=1 Tax=Halteria grandinella TaxID=5974 RepID=A0A8J8NDG7_HALGN|nr:hypothetical protein FGO68_gene3207 [Halteria grandinella]